MSTTQTTFQPDQKVRCSNYEGVGQDLTGRDLIVVRKRAAIEGRANYLVRDVATNRTHILFATELQAVQA